MYAASLEDETSLQRHSVVIPAQFGTLEVAGRGFVMGAPAQEVDPTGAGDVFGLVFGLALASGLDAAAAGRRAALAAAWVVEGPALGRLPECLNWIC